MTREINGQLFRRHMTYYLFTVFFSCDVILRPVKNALFELSEFDEHWHAAVGKPEVLIVSDVDDWEPKLKRGEGWKAVYFQNE